MLESGLVKDVGDRYVLTGHSRLWPFRRPLHDLLMARLDRLASVREVAQIGCLHRQGV